MFLEALSFGIAVAFILLGMVGILIPILPGTILVWFAVLSFAWATGFTVVSPWTFALITLVALFTGTANIWLPMFGAQKTGASRSGIFLGFVGAIVGSFFAPLIGTIIGYALGILLGEMFSHHDLRKATRSSLGGVAGWGLSTMVEIAGALIILVLFVSAALSG